MLLSDYDIQHFAEAAASAEGVVVTGDNSSSDAGESELQTANTERKSFDELVRGDYRREYTERVESIVKNRLKDHAETKQRLSRISEMIGRLGESLGIKADDPEKIVSAVMKEGETEAKAEEADSEVEEKGETVSPDPIIEERARALALRARETREYYPDFDIAKELRDPEFERLLRVTGDPKKAFEMKYHDRILVNAMHYAAQRTEEKLADSLVSKLQRPSESAMNDSSAVVLNSDPKSLSKDERARIKKRVRRGERIVW